MSDGHVTDDDAALRREALWRMRRDRHRTAAVNAGTTLAALVFAWMVWGLVLDSRAPVDVQGLPTVLNQVPVPRNGMLRVRYDIVVVRPCDSESMRVFTDSGGTQYPATPFKSNGREDGNGNPIVPGRSIEEMVEVLVPYGMAPGPAHYVNETQFYCNVWQRMFRRGIVYQYPRVDFQVGTERIDQVAPRGKNLFQRTGQGSPMRWLRNRVWNVGDDE